MKPRDLILAAFTALVPAAASADGALRAFDVAEDLSRFVHDEAPVFDDGMPAFGNAFVTQGYVYPAGTLDGGVEGTPPEGGPAFPDKVIGTWTCDGYYVGDGFRTETGTVVITRQVIVINLDLSIRDLDVRYRLNTRHVPSRYRGYALLPRPIRESRRGVA
jgi:hypothetical protein